jgi:exosortase/archaeosortase family protein
MGDEVQPLEEEVEDLSWAEVAHLGKSYMRIPFALLMVEAFYWFITQPKNTLGPIQVSVAWVWHKLTNLIYGDGASSLSSHDGWVTRVDLHHTAFPDYDTISTYVSDECAGVHEMIFLSTLILMTTGVPQRLRIKSALIGCGIIYVLNVLRLVLFYPIAVADCTELGGVNGCDIGVWQYHTAVYEWGFLVALILIWLVWFKWVNAGDLIKRESAKEKDAWTFAFRNDWQNVHKAIIAISLLLIIGAAANVAFDPDVDLIENCTFEQSAKGLCDDAVDARIQTEDISWSLAAIGMVGSVAAMVTIAQPKSSEEE